MHIAKGWYYIKEAAFHLVVYNPGKAASKCKSLPFLYKAFAALTFGVCPFNKTHMALSGGAIAKLNANQIIRLLASNPEIIAKKTVLNILF